MGRPSMATERTEQIMRAVARCLREYGLAGTTLERVAEESGLSRSHVRHYVGNRDALLRSFATWLYTGYEAQFITKVTEAEPADRLPTAMDYLFGPDFLDTSDDDTVIRELITAGLTDESILATLQKRYMEPVQMLENALEIAYPHATAAARRSVAYGVWCLALGNSMMADMRLPIAGGGLSRTAAEALLTPLAP